MKIVYLTGNLMDANEKVILHGCNDRGVMGSGVAKFVKEKYPDAFRLYRAYFDEGALKLGSNVIWESPSRVVINGVTQRGYGYDGQRYLSYDALYSVLEGANKYCLETDQTHIAMPTIGSLRGGGNWNIIEVMIEEIFQTVTPVVYLYRE